MNHPELGDDPAQVMMRQVIEEGTTDPDDLLQVRIVALRADRGRARAALKRARAAVRPAVDISPIVVERFGEAMRERLTTGEIPFRKAYLGSIVDRVEVDDGEIRIVGRKDVRNRPFWLTVPPFPGFAVLYANGAPGRSAVERAIPRPRGLERLSQTGKGRSEKA